MSPTIDNPTNLDALKRKVGRTPFDQRVRFVNDFAPCPFHHGDGEKSMHLVQKDDAWVATCFSTCSKTWDSIAFVMEFDHVDFKAALARLEGRLDAPQKEKPKPKRMTAEEWTTWGREITREDVQRLARSREGAGKTASFETFQALGCRGKGDYIGFPCRHTEGNNVLYDAIRLRHMDTKEFVIERGVSLHGFFNLDTVNCFEDVYVVEGETDVAVMEEAGFRAVSVMTAAQRKFDSRAIEAIKQAPRIFLVGDQADRSEDPGQKCMDGLYKLLPLESTFRVQFKEAKDVSELAHKLGDSFAARIEELRDESLEPWVVKNLPSISQLSAEPVKWVVDRVLPYGGLSIICGSQGSMKSLLAMFAAQAVSRVPFGEITVSLTERGEPRLGAKHQFLGRSILHGVPVLYVDRENPEGMVSERARRMGILGNRDFIYWGDWSEQTPELDDPRLMEFARRKKGLIVFDALQDWYGDAKEIDNTAMVKLMGQFRKLARAGAGVLVLHHQDKYKHSGFRGGTAIIALTDMAIAAGKSEADPDVLELRPERFRMCAGWEMDVRVHWTAGERHRHAHYYQLEVLKDELVSNAVAQAKAEEQAKSEAKEIKLQEDAEAVATLIGQNPRWSARTLERKLNGKVRRSRMESLAKIHGWFWDADSKSWIKSSDKEDENLF